MKNLFLQAVRFVGISGIGWLLDFTVFMLLSLVSPYPQINNAVSSMLGVTLVFLFSTKKIFSDTGRISLKWKYVIYVVYQLILIYLISMLLGVINRFILSSFTWELLHRFSQMIAKILVTPVTMVTNFFVMKGLIEKL